MPEIALFVEDYAHRQIIGALLSRLAQDCGIEVRLDWRNARHGYGAVAQELRDYLRDLGRQGGPLPDLIIVGTDANCKGLNERIRELQDPQGPARMILAVPDPHVERWLLLAASDRSHLRCRHNAEPGRDRIRRRHLSRLHFRSGASHPLPKTALNAAPSTQ